MHAPTPPRSLRFLGLGLLLACAAGGAQAAICRAAPTASGAADGSTWQDAMTLPAALAASGCDEIWLRQGIYKPGTQRSDTFNIPRPLQLYGGFAGNETEREQRSSNSRLTVLSGDIDGNDTATDNIVLDYSGIAGDNSYHVLRINQAAVALAFTPANTVIDGLTITGGQADGSGWENKGAGLLCLAVNANRECSPRIANVTFSGNLAANEGGGMLTYAKSDGKSSPEITHSTFSGNAALYGGGLAVDITILSDATTGSPSIAHSTFSGNAATGAGSMGGAVYLNGTTAVSVAHVTFANNTSSTYGGALHAHDGTQATITASIFWGNTASNGNQISLKSASTSLGDLTGSLVQGGSGDIYAYAGATLPSGSPYVTNPALGPLQDNGGPTWTMLPPVGSQAANKATCTAGQTDQRGAARPTLAGACDLGAVERMDTTPFLSVAFTPSTDQVRQIALSWAASPESVYYRVTRVSNGATVCQTASTACLLTGLPDGDSVAFNLTGYSDFGNSLLATASGQTLALPATPAGFTATPGLRTVTLAWSTAAGADGYVVTNTTGGGSIVVCNVTTPGCTVPGLADGTAYTFALAARNAAGDSAVAATSGSTFGLPGAPTGLIAAPGDGSVRLQWAAPADDGGSTVTGYTVTMDGQPTSCTASPCRIDGLANGAALGFEVRAVNAVGPGAPAQASATPGSLGNPALPLPGGGTAAVVIGGNPPGCTLSAPITIDDNAPPGAPAGATHPLGVLRFTASGCAGAALAVQVTYPAGRLAGLKPYKYGPPQQGASAAWFPYGTVTGDTVAYTVQDDGTGDNETAAAGVIDDPFVPLALPVGGVGIPTLSQWGVLLLSALSALLGLAVLRRRVF